jgi:hypothetical protein
MHARRTLFEVPPGVAIAAIASYDERASETNSTPRGEPRSMATTHIVRVTLDEDAPIYRDIEIPGGKSLYALAQGIVKAFDFDFDHAFGFYSGLTQRTMMKAHPQYELFADLGEGSDAESVEKTTVAEAFPKVGHTLMFLFDYGDEWLFRVKVLGFGETVARARYPKTVASVGEAPEQYPDWDDD